MSNLAEKSSGGVENNQDLVALVKEHVREAATNRLQSSIQDAKIELTEVFDYQLDEEEDWLVKIVVNAIGLKFKFKVYYSVDTAKFFLSQKKVMQGKEILASFCHDFIRELCNLTAGAIKIWLQGSNTSAKDESGDLIVNLPDQKPAAIDPLIRSGDQGNKIFDSWAYRLGDQVLICASEVVVDDWEKARNLMLASANLEEDDDSGQIEFL